MAKNAMDAAPPCEAAWREHSGGIVKICVFGAGAVGSFFAAKLARAGNDVSVVVRAKNAEAINASGIHVHEKAGEFTARVKASDDPGTLGVQDAILLTTKAQALGPAVDAIAPMVGKNTLIVFTQNGVACWYPHKLAADLRTPPPLPQFEVMKRFAARYGDDQFVGGIVRSSNALTAPGQVHNESATGRNAFLFARTDDKDDPRVSALRAACEAAGIDSPVPLPGIRTEMWRKLIMSNTTGPVAVLTGKETSTMVDDPHLNAVLENLVLDGLELSAAYGFPFPRSEIKLPRNHHKQSLLQDYERNAPMEWGEIVLAAQRFGEAAGLKLPTFNATVNVGTFFVLQRGLLPTPEAWQSKA